MMEIQEQFIKHLIMTFVHISFKNVCYAVTEYESLLQNGDLSVFVRLGTDFNNNYYSTKFTILSFWKHHLRNRL